MILRQMLETREGKRLFLLYRGLSLLSMLLRSRNRLVRGPTATLILTLSSEGDHLPALFATCANDEWMRSCAVALTYAMEAQGKVDDDVDCHVQECLCVLLQRLSSKPKYRSLFRVANLHGILLDSSHAVRKHCLSSLNSGTVSVASCLSPRRNTAGCKIGALCRALAKKDTTAHFLETTWRCCCGRWASNVYRWAGKAMCAVFGVDVLQGPIWRGSGAGIA